MRIRLSRLRQRDLGEQEDFDSPDDFFEPIPAPEFSISGALLDPSRFHRILHERVCEMLLVQP